MLLSTAPRWVYIVDIRDMLLTVVDKKLVSFLNLPIRRLPVQLKFDGNELSSTLF